MAISRSQFSEKDLQMLGRSFGDENAFTTHPQAEKVWNSKLERGQLDRHLSRLTPSSGGSSWGGAPASAPQNSSSWTPPNSDWGIDPYSGGKQGPGIAAAINDNPSLLEGYWDQYPDALVDAVANNPSAFSGGATTQIGQGADYDPGNAATSWGPIGDGAGAGGYDKYTDLAFDNAMRTASPYIDQNRNRFEQSMINRGLAPSSEGYNTAYDQMERTHNDMINDAAFEALGFGANRFDADRAFDLSDRQFGLNELATMDSMNRAWDAVDFRNANFNASREDQQFNQLMSMFGFTPTGSTTGSNMGSLFGDQFRGDMINNNADAQMWNTIGQFVQQGASDINWGDLWGDISGMFGGGGGGGNSMTAGNNWLRQQGII